MTGAKHFKELISWQLADQLRVEIFKFTSRPAFVRDLKLHSQTEDAVNSVCRNISEGFGGSHAEFARFLRISRRSMNELQDAFRAAELKNYVTPADLAPSRRLMRRLYKALGRFIAYLDTTPDPPKPKRPRNPKSPP
jgi:four helix bundle protein